MKKTAITFFAAAFLCGAVFAKPEAERPDWVDNWRTIYPDTTYVAQLAKSTGKKGANDAKAEAANTVAQYIKTNVQSELTSTMKTTSGSKKNGRLYTTEERANSQDIKLSVDLALTSLEYTEPWYNKKEKTWYCVAYASREKLYEQYKPTLQNARDKLFAYYEAADKSQEPLSKMIIYMQSSAYEDDFFAAYSFSNILSPSLTAKDFRKDSQYVSSVSAKSSEEKNKCTFAITVTDDAQDSIYQAIKDSLSSEGYAVKNVGSDALYKVKAAVLFSDTALNSLHVVKPSVEISVEGKTAVVFSYAKQGENLKGLNFDIVKTKAAAEIAAQIRESFMKEFNEKMVKSADDDLRKLFSL